MYCSFRFLAGLISLGALLAVGCSDWPPTRMLEPHAKPNRAEEIHPWIAGLIDKSVPEVQAAIQQRFHTELPALAPLIQRQAEFVPYQIEFANGVGFVRCVRRSRDPRSGQMLYESHYIAQPLAIETIEQRLAYFDEPLRPLLREFLLRFAGSGEEMEGEHSGHFVLNHDVAASELSVGQSDSPHAWENSKRLYASMNGDSVLVNEHGATAWHVLETHEIAPIAATFEDFVSQYAAFRASPRIFDSWAWREFTAGRTDQAK